ncbi:MAG TPA: hypothetical protein VM577_10080 [Anaerovoracaceae bacterium]|nr:hypothetical protein [Anaerovoracaceae bacterium]
MKKAKEYKRKLKTRISSIKKFLSCHARQILYFLVLIVGICLITLSFCTEGNLASVLSGVGTGLLTSLVVSVMINAENDAREKRKRNEDKYFVLNDIVNSSLDVYEDIIHRVNEFVMFSNITTTPVYKLYDNFYEYNAFEKEIKQIDYEASSIELKEQLNTLFNFENYRIDYLIAELKRLPKQEFYLKGLLSKDEYEGLTSNFANDTYLEYAGHLQDFWNKEIKDINKCIYFLRMTIYICSKVISSLNYCRKMAVEKEALIQERLSQRYYEEIYCYSEEYFQQEAERAEAEKEYYAEHPEEWEELQRQTEEAQYETPEDRVLKDLYYCICGFSSHTIEELLDKLEPDSKKAIAFLCRKDIQKSLNKKWKLRKAVKVKFGKDYLKKSTKNEVEDNNSGKNEDGIH